MCPFDEPLENLGCRFSLQLLGAEVFGKTKHFDILELF
jgi:hypothetical protein